MKHRSSGKTEIKRIMSILLTVCILISGTWYSGAVMAEEAVPASDSTVLDEESAATEEAAAEENLTDITALQMDDIQEQTYTGSAVEPEIVLTDGDYVLARDTDYVCEFQNNTDAGEAAVTVTGTGSYTGSLSKSFQIMPAELPEPDPVAEQVYTGREICPDISMEGPSGALKQDVDYTVSCQNNLHAGEATALITGTGNYTGSRTVTFTIGPAKLPAPASLKKQYYTGKGIKPDVTIKFSGTRLTKGTDYSLTYTNNTAIGTAKVKVTGKGDFTGSRTVSFSIVLKPVSGLKAVPGTYSVKLKWGASAGADSYRIYRRDQKDTRWIYLGRTESCSYTDRNRQPGTSYRYAVKAERTSGSQTVRSSKMTVSTSTAAANDTVAFRTRVSAVLYRKPDSSSGKIRTIAAGNKVKVYRSYRKKSGKRTWYLVSYGGKKGYMPASKLVRYTAGGLVRTNAVYTIPDGQITALRSAVSSIRARGHKVSFVLWDCDRDIYFMLDETRSYYSASTVKAPYAISLAQSYLETGKINWNRTYFYRSQMPLRLGTGTIRYDKNTTVYTAKEVIRRTLVESDNMGYLALRDRYGSAHFYRWLEKAGVRQKIASTAYTDITTMELARMWKYASKYLRKDTAYSKWFRSTMSQAKNSPIVISLGSRYEVMAKPGFMQVGTDNDAGLVLKSDSACVLAIMTTMEGYYTTDAQVIRNSRKIQKLAKALDNIHNTYIKSIL